MEDNQPVRKPLSSASAIMHRHTKKKRKWLHNLLHHGDDGKRDGKKVSGSQFYVDKPDKSVSRSLENIGHMNLSVVGFSSCPEKSSSALHLLPDEDSMSVTSVSSCDSDCSMVADGADAEAGITRIASSNSSDNDNVSDIESGYHPSREPGVSQSQDSNFSNWFSYLPFGIGYNSIRGSSDSLNSQSEERKTLSHLLSQSDSDQVKLCRHKVSKQ